MAEQEEWGPRVEQKCQGRWSVVKQMGQGPDLQCMCAHAEGGCAR